MTNEVLDNIKKLAEKYRKALDELNEKIRNFEQVPQAKALVGRCFKFPNSYGSSKWYVYYRIVGSIGINLSVDNFQQEGYRGKIEFEFNKFGYVTQFTPNHEITEKEYFSAQKRLLKNMMAKLEKRKKK